MKNAEYKICSWDVGIKNLAYCIINKKNKKYTIEKWNIINLVESNDSAIKKCCVDNCKTKPKLTCVIYDKLYLYCGRHKKRYTGLDVSWKDIYIERTKNKNKCSYNDKCKSSAYYFCKNKDHSYLCSSHKTSYLKKIDKLAKLTKIPKKKCKSLSTNTLCTTLYKKLDELPELLKLNEILIENQPSFMNPVAKSIASFMFGYFIMKKVNVRYISPSNKLKVNEDRTLEVLNRTVAKEQKYKLTKKLAIKYTKILLKDDKKWIDYLDKYSKKDDLCDAYLQGYHYLEYRLK